MPRKKTETPPEMGERPQGLYFENDRGAEFFSSGCTLLDLALGGGWAENRIINIIGNRSTGKTLLAIEATANYAIKHPKAKIYYTEVEAAFDRPYAQNLGMPMDRIIFPEDVFTVEDWYKRLEKVLDESEGQTALCILDSLDALSDAAELGRDISDATMGTAKAKQMSALFRRINQKLSKSRVTLMIVSQVRENIGVIFGRHTTRSGGRALDFYASQVIYLDMLGQEKRTYKGIQRTVGVNVKAKVDKNKVGLPFREAEFTITFGYGVDDLPACINWLETTKQLEALTTMGKNAYYKYVADLPDEQFRAEIQKVKVVMAKLWNEAELALAPTTKKYP